MISTDIPIHKPRFPFIVSQNRLISKHPNFPLEIVYKPADGMYFFVLQDNNGNEINLPFSSHHDVEFDIIGELTDHCAPEKGNPLNFANKNLYTLYQNDNGIYTAVFWKDSPKGCRIISIPLGNSDRIYFLIEGIEELMEQVITSKKADFLNCSKQYLEELL